MSLERPSSLKEIKQVSYAQGEEGGLAPALCIYFLDPSWQQMVEPKSSKRSTLVTANFLDEKLSKVMKELG